jgi:hypothetical protein
VRSSRWLAAALVPLVMAGCGGDGQATAVRDPGPPTAPADLVAIGAMRDPEALTGLGLAVEPLPAGAELVGAHYAIAIAAVAVAPELTYDQLRELNLHRQFPEAESASLLAGSGREFLVVPLAEPEDADVVAGGDSAEVTVAGERRPLDRVPHELEVLVVNVPAGGEATLSITDAGETKSISLRTGEREGGGGDHPAEALAGGSVDLEEGVVIAGVTRAGYYDGLTVRVTLTPSAHVDEQGWAPDGSMWLEIDVALNYAGLVAEQARLELDVAASLTITGSDGTGVEIPAGTAEAAVTADGALAVLDWSGIAEVPDTLRGFEVSYATQGSFVAPDGSAVSFTRQAVTPTGTVELTER